MAQVPGMMDEQDKLDYLAEHFWDNFADSAALVSCDSTMVSGVAREEVEQAVANYIMLLEQIPLSEAQAYVGSLAARMVDCHKANADARVLTGLGFIWERYVFDPNSPLRDEDLYVPYARIMSECEYKESSEREVYRNDARLSSLNERGTRATDFVFTLKNGRRTSLYGIRADYTVLFFSNPGCHACKDIIEQLDSSPEIAGLVADGIIAVANVYIDEDLSEWYNYSEIYPQLWYNGYDHNHIIRDDELYNVRAIPSLYLLDDSKHVMLKDVTTERLMAVLNNIFGL